jgi:hypothetical protein
MMKYKFAEDKPRDCQYCYWWGGKKRGCTLGEENCYYIIPEKTKKKKNPCEECPYGKGGPCIGFCMKELLQSSRKGSGGKVVSTCGH